MATRYEYHNTYNSWTSFWDDKWAAMTFTPSIGHKITSVKLRICRVGSPGDITVGIRATTDSRPSGEDLCSGTTSGNTLTTDDTDGEIREIALGDGYVLDADTMYAIVCRISGGDVSNRVKWMIDTNEGYADGTEEASNNSGSTWTPQTRDCWFEDWGVLPGWTGKISGVTNPAKIMGVDVANIHSVKGVVAG